MDRNTETRIRAAPANIQPAPGTNMHLLSFTYRSLNAELLYSIRKEIIYKKKDKDKKHDLSCEPEIPDLDKLSGRCSDVLIGQ